MSKQVSPSSKSCLLNPILARRHIPSVDTVRSFESKEHVLSELLPYDPSVKTGDRLKDGLKEYLLLLTATEQAFELLKKGNFHAFDPLVGENACQIRAVKLAVMFSETLFDCERVLHEISLSKRKIKEFLNNIRVLLKNNISLLDLLQQEGLEISIDYKEIFLIKSYLLSKVKITRPFKEEQPLVENAYTDTKMIKEIYPVGSTFAHNLVEFLREKVSERSVSFVQKVAEPNHSILSAEFIFNHRGLQCLPCFWVTQTVMRHAINQHIPIVLLVEQKAKDRNYEVMQKTVLFFHVTTEGYQETTYESLSPEMPAIFLMGSSCSDSKDLLDEKNWKRELVRYSPVDLILAYAATHRQYPNPSHDLILQNLQDKEYEYYKENAEKWGCSLTNPSRFFLSHAFCDKISNVELHI